MNSIFVANGTANAVPIWFVTAATYADVRERLDADARAFADAAGFEPKAGRHLLLPGKNGLGGVLFGIEASGDVKDLFLPGRLPQLLPDGVYRFANDPHDARLAALAVALGSYRFTRYRKSEGHQVKLELSQSLDRDELSHIAEAVTLARDLINTPANDMGPADLEAAARKLAASHNADIRAIVGDDLLGAKFSLDPRRRARRRRGRAAADRHGVGRSTSIRDVTLVGKGVCFDTGGLDIKPDTGMLNMKKDMGGAATCLALAHMIMARGLKVRLRVLIPAVENSIAGAAFRPRDIYRLAQGPHGRDRQHRRRRPADPRRRAGAGRRGEARADRRHRHAHRRRARRARPGHAGRSSPTTTRSPATCRIAQRSENDPLWRIAAVAAL